MKHLTIVRDRWARGGENGCSMLLNSKGAMCCLGFYAKKLGATEGIMDTTAPHCLVGNLRPRRRKTWRERFKGLVKKGDQPTSLANELMTTNDDEFLYSERDRESRIVRLFLKLGVKVKFA